MNKLNSVLLAYKENGMYLVTKWILGSLLLFSLLEALFFPSYENIYGCLSFITGWFLLYYFVLRVRGKERNKCLLPYLALFFLGVSFFWMPLIATLLEGKPLTFRFQNPYLTFNNQLLNLIMFIVAYRLCLKFYKPNNFLIKLSKKMGYFTPPSDMKIWIMGGIGFLSFTYNLIIQGTDDAMAENLGFFGHLMQITRLFISFPFILLFKNVYGQKESEHDYNLKILLSIYFCFVVLLGIATGKRTPILGPVVSIVACYMLPFFTQGKKLLSTRNAIYIFVCVYALTGPIADLSLAMAVGRDDSSKSSANWTFDNILKIYQDKEKLHNIYQTIIIGTDNNGQNSDGWSEYYVDNVIFDRFCNIRVCDATIYYANKLGHDNPRMHEYAKRSLLFLLPTPVLRFFGYNQSKFGHQYSPGDLISSEALNYKYQYHGYRIAGDSGIGLYLWGYKYYFYAIFIYFAFFYFLSSKVFVNSNGRVILSLWTAVELYTIIWLLNNSSGIIRVFHVLFRDGWQNIIIYCLVFALVRRLSK